MFVFRKIWRALFSWNTRFEIRPFAILPTNWGILKFKMLHDVKHIAVATNLNPSMSTITVIKTKNYLNWSIFELGTEFIFFILHCSYFVGQCKYKNTRMLAFYSPYLKGWFFLLPRKISMVRTCKIFWNKQHRTVSKKKWKIYVLNSFRN